MARIAFVSTMGGYPWGGSEELWSQAALVLARRGHHVSASVPRWAGAREALDLLRREGVRVSERPAPLVQGAFRAFAQLLGARAGSSLREAERMLWKGWGRETWLTRARPALVCISSGDSALGTQWLGSCHRRSIPYVTVAQANSELWWPDDEAGARLRTLAAGARRCFFVAEANLRLFQDQIGGRLENAEIVRNPFGVPRDITTTWPPLSDDGDFRLACVGRMYPPAKGQDLVLRVLELPQWRGRKVTVSFFFDGGDAGGMRRLASELGVQDRVEFRGRASPTEIWAEHHALLLPSRYEGLPLVLVEAMLCGRPAIVTAVGGNPEVVSDGETGFVASAPTVTLVSEALERAWSARESWEPMGRRAASTIRALVPADPGAVFADRLEELCGGSRP
jgi:glycosyltransferase involved in cell wall biosynthesis